jgi:hypothetical protein
MIEAINDFFDMQNMTGWKIFILTFAPLVVFFIAIRISDKRFDEIVRKLEEDKYHPKLPN